MTETITKSKIYAFINGSAFGGPLVVALAEDGEHLASHASSNEGWARHDIGLDGSTWKHDAYAKKYPQGFEVVWLDLDKPEDDAIADELVAKNQALGAARKPEESAKGDS